MGLITQITALVQRIALSVRDLRDRSALLDTAAVRFGARNDGARQSFPSGQWSRLSTALNDVYLPHPAYDAAQGRFVAPVDGVYCLGALSTFSMSNGKKLITALYVNGRRFVLLGRGTAGASDYTGFGGSALVPLQAGDRAEVYIYQNSSNGNRTISSTGYNHFWGYLMYER